MGLSGSKVKKGEESGLYTDWDPNFVSIDIDESQDEAATQRAHNTNIVRGMASHGYPPTYEYDVFLSFRGEDTRTSFSADLLAALDRKRIRAYYKDDINLPRGGEIGPELLKAIETSKIAVVVFSKSYATLDWCLDKLVKIMECKSMLNQRVLPIFYDVTESKVLEQKRNLAEALFNGPEEKVESWRAPLTEVSNLAGFRLEPYRPEPEFIEEIVEDIWKRLKGESSTTRHQHIGIANNYSSLDEVSTALRMEGLKATKLIIGIDFTESSEWTGKVSFNNRSLHAIGDTPNPYEMVISIIGKTLAPFDEDNLIPCFGFGDVTTYDQEVFSFHSDHSPCRGHVETLSCYRKIAGNVKLAGPTSYAPVVDAAINIVEKSGGQHHVLLIIADGQVTRSVNTNDTELSPQEEQTIRSVVNARSYPLSIVAVMVGDGPWADMKNFGDELRALKCYNFQMVNFTDIISTNATSTEKETTLAIAALMEIPFQYKAAIEDGIIGLEKGTAKKIIPRPPPIPCTSLPTTEPSNLLLNMVCPICLTNVKDLAFGCGHLTCQDCGSRLSCCPLCREPIRNRLKLYCVMEN